jgi:hypothetical protein
VHRIDSRNVGITVVVEEAFDLAEVAADRRAGHSLDAALERQRMRQAARSGAPPPRAGTVATPPFKREDSGIEWSLRPSARLWHASGGSAGR